MVIRIDKPPPPRVIVSALQIIQPRFRVVDVSAVAQGVLFAEGCCQRAGGAQRIAPCVVGVGHDARAACADEAGHVALRVLDVEILRAVAVHGQRTGRVVDKVQLIAAPRQLHQLVTQIMVIIRRAVDGLRDAPAVGIVAVGDIRPGLAHPRELAAMLPCIRPRAVAQEVADLVRRQTLAVDAREQVAPRGVVVAIGNGTHRRAEGSGGVVILRFALDVPAVIVGIRPRLPRRLIVLPHQLVEAVVGIGRRALAVGDRRDVPARVVGVGIRRRAGFPRPDLSDMIGRSLPSFVGLSIFIDVNPRFSLSTALAGKRRFCPVSNRLFFPSRVLLHLLYCSFNRGSNRREILHAGIILTEHIHVILNRPSLFQI